MNQLGRQARAAMNSLQALTGVARADLIRNIAAGLQEHAGQIVKANEVDMREGREKSLSPAMLDRLFLDHDRIATIVSALQAIADLPDPIGKVQSEWQRPNGLTISRVSVPLGVIAIIYESRPNVTADAAAICLKAGNSVILRGGSESVHSSRAIVAVVRKILQDNDVNPDVVQMVPSQDRDLVGELLAGLDGALDVVVPRGGKALVDRVQRDARVPVIGHLEGLCHIYVHAAADREMAVSIVTNAKLRRTGICGSAETLLVDEGLAPDVIAAVLSSLQDEGCEVRGCDRLRVDFPDMIAANEQDWVTEYLAPIISVKKVDNMSDAMAHIAHFGSGHTDAIITDDQAVADHFLNTVDSAIVMHNASTQFADGGEFGMGAEIGISTSRVHARGPVGAEQLTSYKYVVKGSGQIRPA
ncbi:MAG: glutamate-5-semialdehyde dehydrogenase [Woeseiaceae bacterium]